VLAARHVTHLTAAENGQKLAPAALEGGLKTASSSRLQLVQQREVAQAALSMPTTRGSAHGAFLGYQEIALVPVLFLASLCWSRPTRRRLGRMSCCDFRSDPLPMLRITAFERTTS